MYNLEQNPSALGVALGFFSIALHCHFFIKTVLNLCLKLLVCY